MRLRPLDDRILEVIAGPEDPTRAGEAHCRFGSGRSISTYPQVSAFCALCRCDLPRGVRYHRAAYRLQGNGAFNLIADRFILQVLPNWSIIAVADGCNWGPRPREAAVRACQAFVDFVREQVYAY
jgi:hypothetical protein